MEMPLTTIYTTTTNEETTTAEKITDEIKNMGNKIKDAIVDIFTTGEKKEWVLFYHILSEFNQYYY